MEPQQVILLSSPLRASITRATALLANLLAHISFNCLSRLTTILISHFLLDLQEAYQQKGRVDPDNVLNLGSNISTLSFVDRVIVSISSDLHIKEQDEGKNTTGARVENAQGDRSDITRSELSSSVINIGGPAEQQNLEQDGLAHTHAVWEDSGEILGVPRTPNMHSCSNNREFP